jgi:hypothetical protein
MRLQDVQAGNVVNTTRHADMHLQYDYITTRALWITHVAPLQCQVTPQHDVTLLTKCSMAGDKTRRVLLHRGFTFSRATCRASSLIVIARP